MTSWITVVDQLILCYVDTFFLIRVDAIDIIEVQPKNLINCTSMAHFFVESKAMLTCNFHDIASVRVMFFLCLTSDSQVICSVYGTVAVLKKCDPFCTGKLVCGLCEQGVECCQHGTLSIKSNASIELLTIKSSDEYSPSRLMGQLFNCLVR